MSPTTRVKERIAELTRPTGEEDLMAVDYPQPRFSLSTTAAVAAAALACLGCLLWWAVSSLEHGSAQADFVALADDSAPSGSASSGSVLSGSVDARSTDDAAATSPDSEPKSPKHAAVTGAAVDAYAHSADDIVVSVVGLVQNPGIMTLPDGSRAADALAVAGVLPEADLVRINHAELLSDGQQLVVLSPDDPAPPVSGSGTGDAGTGQSASTRPISLNTATVAELTALHGVGDATASAIIEFRESHGGFASVEQLVEVTGIGPAKFSRLQDEVTV
ncbi:ComEA family DNA-binding protein [Corynebacterium sp. MSK297]|uniref:ComEA family DNA-binding protein n=1 Tax=Corynebacterium sp. MSK297 TaxID=3050221 RepID=UPI00254F1611|nr:ComEA family DNA-binding protein [Corynebacterium sp. MSK297]MDK8846334.1 ComEA family DNA-binding protein [Corynebacterium sp. MSK297]